MSDDLRKERVRSTMAIFLNPQWQKKEARWNLEFSVVLIWSNTLGIVNPAQKKKKSIRNSPMHCFRNALCFLASVATVWSYQCLSWSCRFVARNTEGQKQKIHYKTILFWSFSYMIIPILVVKTSHTLKQALHYFKPCLQKPVMRNYAYAYTHNSLLWMFRLVFQNKPFTIHWVQVY